MVSSLVTAAWVSVAVSAVWPVSSAAAEHEIDEAEDGEFVHLLQTQARTNIHRYAGEVEDDPEGEVEAPPGALKADYDVLEQKREEYSNLKFNKMDYKNLGGLGPHFDSPPNVRYKNVAKTVDGEPVDMILESDNFKTAKPKKVGVFGASAVVNILNGNEVDFTARFVDKEDKPVKLGPFHMSIMDIDTGKEGGQEELTIGGFTKSYLLDETELTKVSMADGRTKFIAGLPGVGADNPSDPLMLTDVQARRTVSFQFPGGLSSFSFSYKVDAVAYEDYGAEDDGRHFLLAGMSSLYFCEANPTVMDLNMASVAYSNLGGLGPDFGSPPALRFSNIAHIENDQMLDMVVTNLTAYEPANTANNGLNGEFAQVNIQGGSSTKFRFMFVTQGSDEPHKMAWNYFSIFDLDHGKKKEQYKETIEVKGFATHYLTESSELALEKHGDRWYTYGSSTPGTGNDNPTNPMNMTQQQMDRSVTLLFHNSAGFDAKFAAEKPKTQGRNFLFSGKSAMVFC